MQAGINALGWGLQRLAIVLGVALIVAVTVAFVFVLGLVVLEAAQTFGD